MMENDDGSSFDPQLTFAALYVEIAALKEKDAEKTKTIKSLQKNDAENTKTIKSLQKKDAEKTKTIKDLEEAVAEAAEGRFASQFFRWHPLPFYIY